MQVDPPPKYISVLLLCSIKIEAITVPLVKSSIIKGACNHCLSAGEDILAVVVRTADKPFALLQAVRNAIKQYKTAG